MSKQPQIQRRIQSFHLISQAIRPLQPTTSGTCCPLSMKNSFSYGGATLKNSLSCNIREYGSLNQFKRLLYQKF